MSDVRADVPAGLVVGVIALPIAMAPAVACGISPRHGTRSVRPARLPPMVAELFPTC